MTVKKEYKKLKDYYYSGNFLLFSKLYNNLNTPSLEASVLAIPVFIELRDWSTTKACINKLIQSTDEYFQKRGILLGHLFSLTDTNASREKWNSLFDLCKQIFTQTSNSKLQFYAKYILLRGKSVSLKIGLRDAKEKGRIIQDFLALLDQYRDQNIEDFDIYNTNY